MKYAGILNDTVVIVEENFKPPVYPPTNDGLKITTVECDDTVQIGDKVVDGKIIGTYRPKEPEPTETELIQAEILLNQAEIIGKQKEQDEILAELLLGQQG